MMHRIELSDLLAPVIQRVQADLSNAMKGFSDRSAAFVLQQFGIKPQAPDYPELHQKSHRGQIAQCAWIDRQLLAFFESEPRAEGIEVNGGLSTRFHRLSEQLDWPQFSWISINTYDVNDWLQFVFPAMDNYQSIGCSEPKEYWQKYVHWNDKKRKIVLVGEQKPLKSWANFDALYSTIQFALSDETPVIDLILTHSIPDFFVTCASRKIKTTLVAKQANSESKKGILKRLFSSLLLTSLPLTYLLPPQKNKTTSVHLRITKH